MKSRILGRLVDHRTSLLRNLAQSLVLHGRLTTTLAKAKATQPLVERWVTLAKQTVLAKEAPRLALHRRLIAEVGHRPAVAKLIGTWAVAAKGRSGGTTRLYRLVARLGDGAPQGRLEFVDQPAAPKAAKTSAETTIVPKARK